MTPYTLCRVQSSELHPALYAEQHPVSSRSRVLFFVMPWDGNAHIRI